MTPILRLYEDTIAGGVPAVSLSARPRMVFVVHGTVEIEGRTIRDGETWDGTEAISLKPGAEGVTVWRYELAAPGGADGAAKGDGVRSMLKLAADLETIPQGELLLRGDSVAFPPGGCAFKHVHQGPGFRCLIEGGIRIDTHGRSTSYGPGAAWYESGPEPVFAQAAADRPSRFIRVMILPRALLGGKSSISLVNEEDKSKPRSQQYKIFADRAIELPKD